MRRNLGAPRIWHPNQRGVPRLCSLSLALSSQRKCKIALVKPWEGRGMNKHVARLAGRRVGVAGTRTAPGAPDGGQRARDSMSASARRRSAPVPGLAPVSLPVLVPVPVPVPVTCGHRHAELTVCSARPSTPERYVCSPLGAGSHTEGRCPGHCGLELLPGPGPASAASRRLAWPWSSRRPRGAPFRFQALLVSGS